MAKTIMIQGTASGVGKTIITAALCRIFANAGLKTAPFKAQNMTSNTAFLGNGGEIAVSQLIQARAAKTSPRTEMNPIILKPSEAKGVTEVILNGRLFKEADAYDLNGIKKLLIPETMKAYEKLALEYDVIVVEGAGSPVELNLNKDDIVNMGLAKRLNAPVLLVSDIDRGGVFASIYGTVKLFCDEERVRVKALLVNRFRGRKEYFEEGVKILEEITGLPVAGVIPYMNINIPEEDCLFESKPDISDSSLDEQIEAIAEEVRKSLNMELIYSILG